MANDKDLNTSEKYYKHLSYNDRCNLQKLISQRSSLNLKSIAEIIGKDPSTISKEVKRNRIFVINNYNRLSWANSVCIHMSECHKTIYARKYVLISYVKNAYNALLNVLILKNESVVNFQNFLGVAMAALNLDIVT